MKFFKKHLPVGLGLFGISLLYRISVNDGNFEWIYLITSGVFAITVTLGLAFMDNHPAFKRDSNKH